MKQCKAVRGWADYPMLELGDIACQKAPIRHVRALHYDGNKYVAVQTECGHIEEIKRGYLYGKPGRCGTVPVINGRKLERMITVLSELL